MMTSVTRRVCFSASRRFAIEGWSDEQNSREFGAWARPHGHSFTVDVTVSGTANETTGMVVDLKRLKALLERHVVEPLDRRDLTAAPLLAGRVATSENLVVSIWGAIAGQLEKGLRLCRVSLSESSRRAVHYQGE